MIRNIVFDMGNVLIRFDPDVFMDQANVADPDDRELIRRELFLSLEWAQMDLGVLSEESAEPLVLARIPTRLHDAVRQLLYRWWEHRDMIPGMEMLVHRLKDAGYRLFLLSNASTSQCRYWPSFPVSRLMEGTLISCDYHIVKPSAEIYRLFTEKFSLNPQECLFVDDLPANVAGAVSCGWHGIVFHGSARELEMKLNQAGIRLQA